MLIKRRTDLDKSIEKKIYKYISTEKTNPYIYIRKEIKKEKRKDAI